MEPLRQPVLAGHVSDRQERRDPVRPNRRRPISGNREIDSESAGRSFVTGRDMRRLSRRNFLKLVGGVAVAAALPTPALAGMLDQLFRSAPRLRPALTSNDELYVTSYRNPPDTASNIGRCRFKGWLNGRSR
ncbi:MAG: twin-arginine translocation signal domain-containing protein [Nitrospiraceae bacterium]|nr:twin-arginine translocation signal domain-containing protein [Nitrospiraceae bacterium]